MRRLSLCHISDIPVNLFPSKSNVEVVSEHRGSGKDPESRFALKYKLATFNRVRGISPVSLLFSK